MKKTLEDIIKEYQQLQVNDQPCEVPELDSCQGKPQKDMKYHAKEMYKDLEMDMLWLISPEAVIYAVLCESLNIGYLLGMSHGKGEINGTVN